MSKKLTSVTVRLDQELLKTFHQVCSQEDLSKAQVIRYLMRRYIAEHTQIDIFKG